MPEFYHRKDFSLYSTSKFASLTGKFGEAIWNSPEECANVQECVTFLTRRGIGGTFTSCLYERDFVIQLYGFDPSPEIQLLVSTVCPFRIHIFSVNPFTDYHLSTNGIIMFAGIQFFPSPLPLLHVPLFPESETPLAGKQGQNVWMAANCY